MALFESKKKTEEGWTYRGYNLLKTADGWKVSLSDDDIKTNKNIERFLSVKHTKLTQTCEIIDELYLGKEYTPSKSSHSLSKDEKTRNIWEDVHKKARSKKCEEIYSEIFPHFMGLNYGKANRHYDELGNVTFKWFEVDTKFEEYKGYPTYNRDVLDEIKDKFKDICTLKFTSSCYLEIIILLSETELTKYFLDIESKN